jgi:predicted permease
MDGWKQDVMFAVRTLRRRPGFTLAAVVTLALGIGATVSIFTVVNGVLLNPLPYPDSDDLVVLWTRDTESGNRSRSVDHPDVRAIQAAVPGLRLAGYSGTRPTLTGFGDPQIVFGARVTDGMVELMGLEPLMGRDLNAADDVAGGPGVAVVSHSFWRERLSGDPDVLGRTLVLSDVPWEIVGVAPEGFDYPGGSDVWLPRRHGDDGCDHGCRIMNAVGRIEASASFEEVSSALEAISARLEEEFPDVHRAERFQLEAMLAYEVADVRTALWVLLGAVGMVLLIACANVANLLLVRAAGRRAEVSLRATLGASRARIARQLLTESGLIALVAGVAGLALAYWGTAALVGLAPDDLPRLDQAKVGGSVIAFTGTLVVLVTGLFGVLPAMHMSRGVDASRGGRGMAGSRQSARSRHALLVGEVALSLTLLLGAGLLFRTLEEMNAVELGFEVERVERFRVSLPDVRYDSVSVGPFLEQIEMELTRLPGVAAAGWGFGVPLASGNISASTHLLDRPEVAPPDQPVFDLRPASSGFLQATGTRLVRGRWFDARDRHGSLPVAVVNEAAVRMHYADRDPIGLLIEPDVTWGFATSPEYTIVGVVEDVVKYGPRDEPAPALYVPNNQFGANTGYVSIRLAPGAATAIPDARRIVASLDPSLALWNVVTMEEVVAEANAPTVFFTTLLAIFAAVALVLAAVGLYGVVAYAVTQRTREIGIRIALGAASAEVTGMVLREGFRPAVMGIVLGLLISSFAARLLSSLLFGVGWNDPTVLVSVSLLLLTVTVVAAAIPARRASRVPPASALQAD